MSSNVGSAFLAVFPVFGGFRKAVNKEVEGATGSATKTFNQGFTKAAQQSGASAGKGFTQGFTTNSKDVGIASLKTLEAQVASTTRANSRARLAEQDAIGKVNVAQAALNGTVGKYAAGSVQVVKATENLASAQRRAQAAGETARGTFSAMTQAQGNLKKATEEAGNTVQKQGSIFSGLGSRLGASISDGFGGAMNTVVGLVGSGISAVTGIAAAGAAAVGVTIGAALAAGFSRLTTIETAQAKLKALGNTSQDIAEIMKNANDAVIGTQYSLADAVTAAASATAAGIKPGQDLTKYLKLQANAAAVAGVDFSDLGLVMNQVQSQNKAYTQDLNQVASRGIPIYQSLAKVYGVTQEGLRDMLQKGEIDAAHFRQALELNVGNAADEIGKTTVGSFENMKAAFTRFGAALLQPAFPAFAKIFTGVQETLNKLGKAFQPIIEKYAPKLAAAFAPLTDAIGPAVNKLIDDIITAANSPEGQKWFADMGVALREIGKALKEALPTLIKFLEVTGKLVADGLLLAAKMAPAWIHGAQQIGDAFNLVSENIDTVVKKINEGTFWETVAQKFSNGWDQLVEISANGGKQIGDFFSTWFANLGPGLANGWAQITGAFSNGWNQITTGFGPWMASLGAAFANGWNQIVAGFANGWNQIMAGFANGANQIGAAFGNGLNQLGSMFANGWSQIVAGFANGWNQIIAGFANGANQIGAFFGGLVGRITSAIGDIQSKFYVIGAQIVQGIISGVTGWAQNAANAVAQVANNMLNAAKNALGIHSPSQVFADEVGAQIGAGIVEGINASKKGVTAAVSSLVGVPTTKTRSYASTSTSATSGPGWASNAPLIGTVVAPDQDPIVSGRIIGREALRLLAGA